MTSVGLPTELVEEILSFSWASSLSIDQRITLMTCATLVNSTWRAIYLHVSSRDVYIPCPSFAEHFLRTLESQSMANRLCRCLTIQIINATRTAPAETEMPMERTLASLLYRLYDPSTPLVPNLRRVVVQYHDTGFEGIFNNWSLIAFPRQVIELELRYSFSPSMPPWLSEALRSKHKRQINRPPWTTPSIRTLTVFGASESLVFGVGY
ncbi:hypothetical protein B0H16DRAFT_1369698, partial [Mycena metata]